MPSAEAKQSALHVNFTSRTLCTALSVRTQMATWHDLLHVADICGNTASGMQHAFGAFENTLSDLGDQRIVCWQDQRTAAACQEAPPNLKFASKAHPFTVLRLVLQLCNQWGFAFGSIGILHMLCAM
jgi:hypothetical protein